MRRLSILLALLATACACNNGSQEQETLPDVPKGLTVLDATETALTFQWTAVSEASSYDWRLLEDRTEVKKGSIDARSVTVDGLTKATAYRFAVRSVSAAGHSDWSTWLDASTEEGEEPEEAAEEAEEALHVHWPRCVERPRHALHRQDDLEQLRRKPACAE